MSPLRPLEALLEIVHASYGTTTVEWFPGDDDDAPGYRAFGVDNVGLYCVGAPPRLTCEEAEADQQWIRRDLEYGFIYEAPEDWPGRQYGILPENCGYSSPWGMDIAEENYPYWYSWAIQAIRCGMVKHPEAKQPQLALSA
jgi:hypothetical protein